MWLRSLNSSYAHISEYRPRRKRERAFRDDERQSRIVGLVGVW
jgi:hypothetical protein